MNAITLISETAGKLLTGKLTRIKTARRAIPFTATSARLAIINLKWKGIVNMAISTAIYFLEKALDKLGEGDTAETKAYIRDAIAKLKRIQDQIKYIEQHTREIGEI
jgi:hypothetical protein